MAIQTVTSENLSEFAAGRKQPPSASEKPVEGKSDGPTPGNPVIKTGEETLGAAPDPGNQGSSEKKPKPVQPRIDELIREKKELDEAFQDEYEHRLRLEGELNALRSKPEEKTPEAPKELKAPDPKDYTDQAKYDADVKAYQDALIDARVEKKLAEERLQRDLEAQNAAMANRIAEAKKAIPDFQEVIEAADRQKPIVPNHIKAAIIESDLGPHIAYHLAKHPDEQKRIFALPAAKALLELGKIELQYAPKADTETVKADDPKPPETTRAPAPIAKLKDSPGSVATPDLSKPMQFSDYRKARLEQIRSSGRRRH